jgi:hypothetical protein
MLSKCRGFSHTRVTALITATVCRCCKVPLAYSPNPQLLVVVEKQHACLKQQMEQQ